MEAARDSSTPAQVRDPQGPAGPALGVLRPDVLLGDHRATLKRLRGLAGVPGAHWEALYREALRRYAGFVQRLPAQAAGAEPGNRQLLDLGLQIVAGALAMRQGRLLPPGADPEVLIRAQDTWTYALFSAALLASLDKLGELEVECLDRRGKRLGIWQPCAGPISEPAVGYRVRRRPTGQEANIPLPFLVHHVMPNDGVGWLASDVRVFRTLYGVLTGDRERSGGIVALLEAARRSVASPQCGRPEVHGDTAAARFAFARPTAAPVSPLPEAPPNPGLDFLEWLREGLRTRSLPVNAPDGLAHVTAEGLLLVSPAIFRAFDSPDWARVQRRFARLRLHARNGDASNIHTYLLPGRRARAVRGYLMPAPDRALGDIPLPPPNPQLTRKRARDE